MQATQRQKGWVQERLTASDEEGGEHVGERCATPRWQIGRKRSAIGTCTASNPARQDTACPNLVWQWTRQCREWQPLQWSCRLLAMLIGVGSVERIGRALVSTWAACRKAVPNCLTVLVSFEHVCAGFCWTICVTFVWEALHALHQPLRCTVHDLRLALKHNAVLLTMQYNAYDEAVG